MTPASRRVLVVLLVATSIVLGTAMAAAVVWTGTTSSSGNNVAATTTFARCYSDDVITDAPVSYWRMEDASGTTATDARGANAGTYVGAPTLATSGALADSASKAVMLDGSSQYVSVADSSTLDTADVMSLELWVKRNTVGTLQVLLDKGVDSYRLQFSAANTVQLTKAGTVIASTTTAVADTTQFHHVAATKTGITTKLFVDGVDRTGTVTNQTLVNSADPLGIGTTSPTAGSYASAVIDEVAVYNSELSATRVLAHYSSGRCGGDEQRADSAVARWRLGETSGPFAFDDMGYAHGRYNGTLTRGQSGAIKNDTNLATTFDGTTGYVETAHSSTINPSIFSVEAWAYPTGGSGSHRAVVSSRDVPDPNDFTKDLGYSLYAGALDNWRLVIASGNGGGDQVIDIEAVRLNTWTHLVVTYDGTTVRLYVNGVVVGALDFSTTPFAPNTRTPFRIGAGENESATPGFYFPGKIDDVAVYNTALSSTRVSAHYVGGKAYRDVVLDSSPAPLGYWRLGEASGTVANDVKATNNGSYVNSPVLSASGALAGDTDTGVSLNGTNQYVNVPDSNSLDTANAFAAEFWIKRNAIGRLEHLLSKGALNYGIRFNSSDYLEFWRNAGTGPNVQKIMVTSTVAISDTTTWHHIHVSKNGNTMMLYIDGVDRLGATLDPYILQDNNNALRFGSASSTAGSYVSGTIDEVALWATPLPADAVKVHYAAGRDAPR